jgi:hypothetical protein
MAVFRRPTRLGATQARELRCERAGKSGKQIERCIISTFQVAEILGFKGRLSSLVSQRRAQVMRLTKGNSRRNWDGEDVQEAVRVHYGIDPPGETTLDPWHTSVEANKYPLVLRQSPSLTFPGPLLSLCALGNAPFPLQTPGQRPGGPKAISYQFLLCFQKTAEG